MHKDEIHALITDAHLDDLARRWGGTAGDVEFIRAMENFVYAFAPGGREWILRLTHDSHRGEDEVAAELEFVDYLARHDVPVAHPVASRGGRLIEPIEAGGTVFFAAVFEKAPGAPIDFSLPPAELARVYQRWGALLGAMHRVVPGYRGDGRDPRRHFGLDDDITRHAARYLPESAQHLTGIFREVVAEVSALPRTRDTFGLLHTDCHHGNFFVDGDRLTLFDFDDCCHHWFLYDVMVPAWHFPIPNRGVQPERDRAALTGFFREFIRGYRTERSFPRAWIDQLPLFFRLRDLQLFVFSWKMWDRHNLEDGQRDFLRRRQALIESRRPSAAINPDDLGL